MPLFPYKVNADTITSSNIIGVNRTLVNTSLIESHTVNISPLGDVVIARYSYEYELTVQLDDYYLGYINGSFSTSLTDVNYADGTLYNRTASKNNSSYYVNGNSFTTSFSTIACFRVIQGSNNDPTGTYNTTFTLNTSNITKYQDLNSIDTVINILNDINSYISIDLLDELQNIVSNTSLSNDYLEMIQQYSRYNIPIESLSANSMWMNAYYENLGQIQLLDFYKSVYKEYPIYKLPDHTVAFNRIFYNYVNPDDPVTIILISPQIPTSQIWNNLSITGTHTHTEENAKASFNMRYPDQDINTNTQIPVWYCKKITISTSSRTVITVKWNIDNVYFIPIYIGTKSQQKNIGTEFALNWGLTNSFLENINIIAQGTSASTSSSNDLEDSADDIVQNSSTMFQFENQQNTNMNNALQSINTNFDIGTIGSSFLTSAAWVKTQFDNLTNTTPFGSVLSFSLLLGLALLIIGKVYK